MATLFYFEPPFIFPPRLRVAASAEQGNEEMFSYSLPDGATLYTHFLINKAPKKLKIKIVLKSEIPDATNDNIP